MASLTLIVDRSALTNTELTYPVSYDDCLYILVEGLTPAEDPGVGGIVSALAVRFHLSAAAAFTDVVDVIDVSATPLTAFAAGMGTYVVTCRLNMASTSDFGFPPASKDLFAKARLTLGAAITDTAVPATIRLLANVGNPYMLDGAVSWLSDSVRVFKVVRGSAPAGTTGFGTLGAAQTALQYLTQELASMTDAKFNSIPTDISASALSLAPQQGGQDVFNFAIARVQYKEGTATPFPVQVFFRLNNLVVTNLTYDAESAATSNEGRYAWDSFTPGAFTVRRARLGSVIGSPATLLSIPCYGVARGADATPPDDTINRKMLMAVAGSTPQSYFYGAWLDFNHDTVTRWNGQTSAQVIGGMHQCLVAELDYEGDRNKNGDTPQTSDNLSQRNLIIQ
jgi:hypothetical protein